MKRTLFLLFNILSSGFVKLIFFSGIIYFLMTFNWSIPSKMLVAFWTSVLLCFFPIIFLKKNLRKKTVLFCSLLPFVFDVLLCFFVLVLTYLRQGVFFDSGVLILFFFIVTLSEILLWLCFFALYYFELI